MMFLESMSMTPMLMLMPTSCGCADADADAIYDADTLQPSYPSLRNFEQACPALVFPK